MIREKWVVEKSYKDLCIEALTDNLVPLRAKAGITQEELANIVGVSRQTYYAIEAKKKDMSWNTYVSLLFFFDTNLNTHALLRDVNAYPTELVVCMSGNQ